MHRCKHHEKHLELSWKASFHHFPESIFEVSRNESGMRRSRIPPTDWDSHGMAPLVTSTRKVAVDNVIIFIILEEFYIIFWQ